MRSICKAAIRLALGFLIAGNIALEPQPSFAARQSVLNKLERFLTGKGPASRSQKHKTRSGRKSGKPSDHRTTKQTKPPGTQPDRRSNAAAAPGVSGAPLPRREDGQPSAKPALPAVVAVPAVKPGSKETPESSDNPAAKQDLNPSAPLPSPAPRPPADVEAPAPQEDGVARRPPYEVSNDDPASPPDAAASPPEDEKACRARLLAMGAQFEERPPEADPVAGCSLPHPILVTRLSKTVALEPAGLLNCAMAEATARFVRDTVAGAARTQMGSELTGVTQASAYVCRTRHGRSTISEHAFGNALDISRFSFADGSTAEVNLTPAEKQGRFLAAVRKAACGPFKTVLGPGSDPDHATHFHLDLEQRRHGGTFCQ